MRPIHFEDFSSLARYLAQPSPYEGMSVYEAFIDGECVWGGTERNEGLDFLKERLREYLK